MLSAAGDVLRGGTSATQWQKFHTDDANQCLHNNSGYHGVPNVNLSNFMCLLVDFFFHLPTSSSETQMLLLGQGWIQDFFLGRGALVSCSTSTPINRIVFFFLVEYQNTLPLDPPLEGRLYSTNIDCFVRDCSRLHVHLTFVAFCLLSVIRKQKLKQCNYSVNQSALLTGFRTDFTSSGWNFCCWVTDDTPSKTSQVAKSEEKRMFSQATT